MNDLKFALRQLAKNPGFTAVAVITLALGIGANTAIFSMVNGVLLRRPPIPRPNQVVVVLATNPAKGTDRYPVSVPDFMALREPNHCFDKIAASEGDGFILTGSGDPERLRGMRVSSSYFPVLGMSAALGRTFDAGEDQLGKEHEVVLSHDLWQDRFDSDPGVVGKLVSLNGETYSVIGVMPAHFKLLTFGVSIWVPLNFDPNRLNPAQREVRSLDVIARLKPGTTVESARAEIAAIAKRLDQSYPLAAQGWGATVVPLQKYMVEYVHVESALVFLMGTVLFVLLIACANVANLLLARAATRQTEFAIRAAVGAGRFRLIRQLLVESVLLALAGGVLGLLLADWGVDSLRAALSWNEYVRSMAAETRIDPTVLAFTLGTSVLAAMLFGLAPAVRGTVTNLTVAMKEGGLRTSAGCGHSRSRNVFVAGEIGLALVLLVGAGLFVQQFIESLHRRLGVDPKGVLTAKISLPRSGANDPSKQAVFFQKVVEHMEALPGVVSAGVTTILPPSEQGQIVKFDLQGQPAPTREALPQTRYFAISPHFLQALRIPLIQGRYFSPFDNAQAPGVALVNQAFVQRFFPQGTPLGKYLELETGRTNQASRCEIVGVVGNVADWFGEPHDEPQVYQSFLQSPSSEMTLVARTSFDPAALAPMLRRAVWDVDKDQPVAELRTMNQVIVDSGAGDRLMSVLMGIFAVLALVLATVGIFGVVAYTVSQRTHEIGIRMALGARKGDVLRLIVGKGILVAALGAGVGLALALPLPHLMNAAFVGFSAHAIPVFLCVSLLIVFVTLLASFVPARRASKIDPMEALRYE